MLVVLRVGCFFGKSMVQESIATAGAQSKDRHVLYAMIKSSMRVYNQKVLNVEKAGRTSSDIYCMYIRITTTAISPMVNEADGSTCIPRFVDQGALRMQVSRFKVLSGSGIFNAIKLYLVIFLLCTSAVGNCSIHLMHKDRGSVSRRQASPSDRLPRGGRVRVGTPTPPQCWHHHDSA